MTTPVEPGHTGSAQQGDQRSLGEIVGDIATDLTTMVRSELELAKVEAKQEAVKAAKAGGAFGGAAVTGYFALLFLSLFAMFLLGKAMELQWAALIVFAVYAIATAALGLVGRTKVQELSNPLEASQKNIKEDVTWATNRN